jgi:hypothetical protein
MLPRRLSGFGHPDRVQVLLGLGLHALGQLVQHVGGLVDPAALLDQERQCILVVIGADERG